MRVVYPKESVVSTEGRDLTDLLNEKISRSTRNDEIVYAVWAHDTRRMRISWR
jgi:hypothetical protein